MTIDELELHEFDIKDYNYEYQTDLTFKLDNLNSDFNQEIINEIVLWKVNRFASIDNNTINLINRIKKTDKEINIELTEAILSNLLSKDQKGVRLAMASTILRFKNPIIYQIIDQRVYRFIYGEEFKYSETNINKQIKTYLDYLSKLKKTCIEHNIDFQNADRIFYSMDRKYNFNKKLKEY